MRTFDTIFAVQEGGAGSTTNAVFTVKLSNPSSKPVTVSYTVVPVSAGPGDYLVTGVKTTFEPFLTATAVPVAVQGDAEPEDDEVFFLKLTGAANATLGDPVTGAAVIKNDD